MSFPAVAPAPTFALGYSMPKPGPLGRLIRRRRLDMNMTQWDLSDRTEELGCRVRQNTISRLESGISHRINNARHLEVLAKALHFENDQAFIMAAYGPKAVPREETFLVEPEGAIIRIVRETLELDDDQTNELARFIEHVRHSPPDAEGPSPEERIARYARELAERRDPDLNPVPVS